MASRGEGPAVGVAARDADVIYRRGRIAVVQDPHLSTLALAFIVRAAPMKVTKMLTNWKQHIVTQRVVVSMAGCSIAVNLKRL
jgi:hypothetical protein